MLMKVELVLDEEQIRSMWQMGNAEFLGVTREAWKYSTTMIFIPLEPKTKL